ncbi:MAG: FkbM family methyltransferase [Verrucomicrobiia bacterium]|jgi:FkbM family methyltransferase
MKKDSLKALLKSAPPGVLGTMRLLSIRPLRAYIRYAPSSLGKQVLYDRLAAHLWSLETDVVAETVFGSRLCVNARDIVGRFIYYFGVWEPNLTGWIQQRLATGDVFVDVGANIGYYSLLASKLVGDSGKVVAVEALPESFRKLQDNVRVNSSRNVRSVNVAAWHRDEQVRIYTQPASPSGTTTLMRAWAARCDLEPYCEVPAKPLLDILRPEEIKAARLIKIDVEGAEWNVVSCMAPLLRDSRKDLEIVVEISRSMLEAQGKTEGDILGLFSDWGFHSYRIENDYSAAAYLTPNPPIRPKRIERIPNGSGDQSDVIFSRVDAASL